MDMFPGTVHADSIAILKATKVQHLSPGCMAFVGSTYQLYKLVRGGSSAVVTDDLHIVPTPDPYSYWIRQNFRDVADASVVNNAPNPNASHSWYIDPTNGDDANDGQSNVTALKSWAQLAARWDTAPRVDASVDVHLLGSLLATDQLRVERPVSSSFPIRVYGQLTSAMPVGYATGTFTTNTHGINHVANAYTAVEDTALPGGFASLADGMHIIVTTGATNPGYWAILLSPTALGGQGANTAAYCTPFVKEVTPGNSQLLFQAPLANVQYVIYTLSTIPDQPLIDIDANAEVRLYNIMMAKSNTAFGRSGVRSGTLRMRASLARDAVGNTPAIDVRGAGSLAIDSTHIVGTSMNVSNDSACIVTASYIDAQPTVRGLLAVDGDCVLAPSATLSTDPMNGPSLLEISDLCVDGNTGTPIRAGANGKIRISTTIYGQNVAVGQVVDLRGTKAQCTYGTAGQITATHAGGGAAVINFGNAVTKVAGGVPTIPFVSAVSAADSQSSMLPATIN